MPLKAGTNLETNLGNYAILAPMGAGGMGEVYRARDTRLERDIAVKGYRKRSRDPERMQRSCTDRNRMAPRNRRLRRHCRGAAQCGAAILLPTCGRT